MGKVELVVLIYTKPGKNKEVLTSLQELAVPSRAEPGNELYDIFASETPDLIVMHEIWKDEDAFDYHMQTPHFRAWKAKTQPLLQRELEIFKLHRVE